MAAESAVSLHTGFSIMSPDTPDDPPMLTFGPLTLGTRPHIAVSVTDRWDDASIAQAVAAGMHIAELRVDLFRKPSVESAQTLLQSLARFPHIATLLTVRSRFEGGQWAGDEPQRLEVIQQLLPQVDAVDIEWSARDIRPAVIAAANALTRRVVLSHHDFDRTAATAELERYIHEAQQAGASIVKLATRVNSTDDLVRLTALMAQHKAANLVLIGMGAQGALTRLAFPALGSLFTFAHFGEATAPGQVELSQLQADLSRYCPA